MSDAITGQVHAERPADEVGGLWAPRLRALTAGLVLTITFVAAEALAVATIMPIVVGELGGLELYGWTFAAFFLGSLIGIVVVGGFVDRGGLVRPFIACVGLFAVGLLCSGLAPTMPVLLAGRFLQGLGGGAIIPIGYVAIGRALPQRLQARMFALFATAWVVPGLIGPAVSGTIADVAGWRIVFLGLIPLVLVSAAIALPALAAVPKAPDRVATDGPEPGEAEGEAGRRRDTQRRRLGLALALAAGSGLLLAGLTSSGLGEASLLAGAGLVLGVPAFRRLTPAGTLRARGPLGSAVLLRGILDFAFFGASAYVPLVFQELRGTSAAVSGIALTAASLSWTAAAWIQARLIETRGARWLIGAGFAFVLVGVGTFALVLSPSIPIAAGIVAWAVAGAGMGLAYASLTMVVLREAPPGGEGTATSGLQLSDVLGQALGPGCAGAVVALGLRSAWPDAAALAGVFAMGVATALGGLLLVRRLR